MIYKAIIKSVIVYEAEMWTVNVQDQNKFLSIDCLQRVARRSRWKESGIIQLGTQ